MKKILVIIIFIFSVFLLCGCDKDGTKKPYLLFNSLPINQKTVYSAQKVFAPGQTINYVILMPKGFKQEYLKMQIIKKPDNVPHGGASIYMSDSLYVDTSKKFYIDKFIIRQTGCYMVRIFYGNNLTKPFVENILWVKE